ncbi:NHLP bacteriocin export ABC transporter permease/ATPase subunit [Alkaliphilus peptidifermentans]|uniref:ATP-binding cassette, subfamily C n=1 Tax=Alkaliphilus peptidifermentans DSM 18978 TaxID=1120976 RepID=A0A1G5EVB8_9FIRM|nr:NHLP bacteriocin export ABC transporter permease/ATPase subunit [Alkaliphilus peptidifermentans]SCY30917.1 ATP-binding cassette, subfamily C [Alkaliphilus peptidifermentans DSM 18978]
MKRYLDHSKPIVMEENMSYHVVSGVINLFLVKDSEKSAIEHRRHFLISVEEGTTIIGGIAKLEHGNYHFVAIGSGNAEIQSFPIEETEASRESIIKWLMYISDHADRELLNALSELPCSELLTLVRTYTLNYVNVKAEELKSEQILHDEKYYEKRQNEADLINKAVQLLTEDEIETITHHKASVFLKTCQVVAIALNMKITEPKPFYEHQQQPYTLMKTYFQKTNIRYRRITLSGLWWKHVDGTMVAFNSNMQPVPLLPTTKGRYEIIDVEMGTSTLVNEESATGILKEAFMIYRPLPDKEIHGRELLSFGFHRIAKRDYMLFFISVISIGFLGMAVPLLTGLTVDWIIPQGDLSLLLQMGIMLAVVAITTFLFNLSRGFILLRVEGQFDVDLQTAVWDRLLHLPLNFFKQFTSAELAARALGITMIRDIVSGPVMSMLLTGIYSLFSWLVLFYYHIPLAIVASLMMIISIIGNYFLSKRVLAYEYKINQLTNKIAGLTFQLIKGAIKIQQSGAIERAYYKWATDQAEKHKTIQSKGIITSRMEAFNGLHLPISIGIIYYLITMQPYFYLPAGHFIGFNAAYMIFASAVLNIYSSVHLLFQVVPLYDRGKIILETKPECKGDKIILEEPLGKISVDNIHFQYDPKGQAILKDVSLEIKPGEYVGIVGTSGSGKSTLMRLLLGFEISNRGKITYDDKDINSLDLSELRKRIGVVLQNGKLMTDSIYHNIVGTHLHLTMEDAWEAAKVAGIDEDIKGMPMGMHTIVMEGAGTISGGQKQRILIARAVVNKPKILFFDEATSALDNITQAKIKKSLDQFSATRIIIAHRLSTVKNCDRIIVLDNGEIKETGNYEELINRKGVFYQIAERQLA